MDFTKYPKTTIFEVIDTIGVPHSYMITEKHVAFTSDHFNGMLSEAAITAGEKQRIHCGQKGCTLTYHQHEQAALIQCTTSGTLQDHHIELNEYLNSIKDLLVQDNFAGVLFTQKIPTAEIIEE
jgi:hypothetical protein